MRKIMHQSLVLCLVSLLIGCSSPTIKIDRIEATPEINSDYRSILVFAVSGKNHVRETIETQLVNALNKEGFEAQAFDPSNESLQWDDPTKIQSLVTSAAKAGNFDGVLVTSLVKKEKKSRYVPEQITYQPFTVGMGLLASTTYIQTTRFSGYYENSINYALESTLFDTNSGQSVWQAFSSTLDPKSLDSAAQTYGSVIVKALRGTIQKAEKSQ